MHTNIAHSATSAAPAESAVPKLGVGLAYQGPLRSFIESEHELLDFLEVVPDILWTDRGVGENPRYIEDADSVAFIGQVHSSVPIIPHGIGLSIGSAHRFNVDHIEQLAGWHARFQFPWHSDHLSYNLAQNGTHEINTGVTLPLPHDRATLDLLVPRIHEIQRRVPIPFLLENNVYYFELADQEFEEADFLNALCRESGCGLLLDLHNLYVNSRNLRTDPMKFLDRLNLDAVIEIHLAGGMELNGFYLDAHSGAVPPPVWKLFERALPSCPNLRGVTFELFGSWVSSVGEQKVARELAQMKELWARYQ